MRSGFREWLVYLRLMCRRILTILPVILLMTGLLFGAVLILGGAMLRSNEEDAAKSKVALGVVGEYEDSYLELAVTALQNMDTSRFSMELQMMEEEEAKRRMREGTIQAYLVIPEGFFEGVDQYTNDVQITYVSTDGAVGIGTVMINEIAEAVGELLIESENAVYGMQNYTAEHFPDAFSLTDISNLGYAMVEEYGLRIFSREQLYEVTETGVSGNLTFNSYYVCAVLLMFLLLWGITLSPLYAERDDALQSLLRQRGLSVFAQAAAEYIAYACTMLLFVLLLLPAAGILLTESGIPVKELAKLRSAYGGMGTYFSLLPAVILAVFLMAAVQFLLYELTTGMVPGILMQVFAGLLAGYFSGCFYPISYFPEMMQKTANALPVGKVRLLLTQKLLGTLSAGTVFAVLGYTVLCLAAAAAVRRMRRR